jgi:multiple sugar transport system permease protein
MFWLFVGPFLIGLAICAYLPIGWGAYLSFFDARNTVAPTTFIGLDNYVAMLCNEAATDLPQLRQRDVPQRLPAGIAA